MFVNVIDVNWVHFYDNLYEWCRMPFGLRSASQIYCRCTEMILRPIRDFSFAYVDDMTVGSDKWKQHLLHVRSLLTEVKKSGLILALNKCKFAHHEVRFIGHIVGSGRHRPDEQKLAVIATLANPQTKKEIRRMLGFFNFFIRIFRIWQS